MKGLALLIGVPALLWLILLGPAWMLWGAAAFLQSGVALAICLVPAVATLIAIERFGNSPESRFLVGFGSTGIRMAAVLGIGFLFFRTMPETFPLPFLYWLTLFYLTALAIEVSLLVRPAPNQAKNPEA
jgi:hypothetical protein